MKTIAGKNALIVGGASGIGYAIALSLAQRGANLFLVDRDAAALEEAARSVKLSHSQDVRSRVSDASKADDVHAVIEEVRTAWGELDILVNSAGDLYWGPTDAMTPEQLERTIANNLDAVIYYTRECLPLLLQREESHIVNVGSTAGLLGAHGRSVYSATKAGLVGLSESLRVENARRGLGVSVLVPAYVRDTRLFQNVMTASGTVSRVDPSWEEGFRSAFGVGEAAVRAIYSRNGVTYTTPIEGLIWWLISLAPNLTQRLYGRLSRQGKGSFAEPPIIQVANEP